MRKTNTHIKTKEIDIHNMFELEALKFLEKELIRLHKLGFRRLIIIHGFNGGKILKEMVHKKLRSKLIISRQQGLFNLGETELVLKD